MIWKYLKCKVHFKGDVFRDCSSLQPNCNLDLCHNVDTNSIIPNPSALYVILETLWQSIYRPKKTDGFDTCSLLKIENAPSSLSNKALRIHGNLKHHMMLNTCKCLSFIDTFDLNQFFCQFCCIMSVVT